MTTTAAATATGSPLAAVRAPGARPARRTLDALIVGVVGAALAFAFSWVPSLWYDESATVVSATRSWSALARMLTTVDIVHATYYAGMHVWFDLVGYTPTTLRLPSALATGAAAALIVVLGRMLAGRRVGFLAGVAFCLFPRVTWMGTEGRSFAVGTLLAVAMTIAYLRAWRAPTRSRRGWVVYAALAILGTAVFLYLALLVVAHAVTALACARRDRLAGEAKGGRIRLLRSAVSAGIALVAVVPLAAEASRQSGQIHWIPRPSVHTVAEVLQTQWFIGSPGFAVAAWTAVVVAVALILRSRRPAGLELLGVALPWMLVPTVLLVAESVVHSPMYSPRYLTFAAPGAALLVGYALAALPRRRLAAAALAVLVVLSAPTYVAQRQVTAKDSSAWNQVAALIATQRSLEPAGVVSDVVYGPVDRHPLTSSRVIAQTYPTAFVGLDDITLKTPGDRTDHMWSTQYPLSAVVGKTVAARDVWLVTGTSADQRPLVTKELAAAGFHIDGQWHFSRTNVVHYVR
ncbi:glycosyltransferase family 39 protein [Frondihabitans australicus]|uniref:Mannosyltransferase n=1 Tax=Frondihabitans australicus TaxID=386892 RepID=A0A495IIY3_9MICO|nr:glycosyltransferase family 39 protein [Frondihabitans australicus]RKR75368.1 mannosyltransferase [Frondihabitans australicus]